jgi:hypothetical protein
MFYITIVYTSKMNGIIFVIGTIVDCSYDVIGIVRTKCIIFGNRISGPT